MAEEKKLHERQELRLAVLIDADNVSYEYVKPMMAEVARYGNPTLKRIYGDWTKPEAGGWKRQLLENAITPIQQYGYTYGKNATDSAMIIDAMDILYSNRVDGFCLVSSDSDFTRLATRLREAGMLVIGIGEQKTPQPFIVACDRFIYLEILQAEEPVERTERTHASQPRKVQKKTYNQLPPEVLKLIVDSVNAVADEDGWAFLADVGNFLLRNQPSFDSRNYGYQKLTALMSSISRFEIDKRDTANRGVKHIYIRDKQADAPKS